MESRQLTGSDIQWGRNQDEGSRGGRGAGQTEGGNLEREDLDAHVHEDRKDNSRFSENQQEIGFWFYFYY